MRRYRPPLFFLLLITLFGSSIAFANNNEILELEYPENLKLIKRDVWGWKPINSSFKTHIIKYITVHHGGIKFQPDQDPTNHVKNLQSWSRSDKKWIDIPYHFMIDLKGNIFEARPINIPGDTNTEYDPTSHLLVEVMGNYEVQILSDVQLTSMIDLIKYLSKRFNVTIENIKTHRDYSTQTICPGKNIYQYFENGTIKQMLTES